MSNEQWRAIPSFEGVYEVSDLGRVRSLDRKVKHKNGTVQSLRGRVLATATGGDGRKYVSLSRHGKTTVCFIDDLLREVFGTESIPPVTAKPVETPTTGGEVVPFTFDNHQVRVIVDLEGNPWWVAADVCAVLGIGDVSMALSRLDPVDTSSASAQTTRGQMRPMKIVNESGLYDRYMVHRWPLDVWDQAARELGWIA